MSTRSNDFTKNFSRLAPMYIPLIFNYKRCTSNVFSSNSPQIITSHNDVYTCNGCHVHTRIPSTSSFAIQFST